MKSRLNLSIDKVILERSKIYARKSGRSLSEIVEKYLDLISVEPSLDTTSSKLLKIMGSVNLPANADLDKLARKHLEKKHLK